MRLALAALVLTAAVTAAAAQYLDEDEISRPPPSLPESVNGSIRARDAGRSADRIDRLREVFPAVRFCWRLPAGERGTGRIVTLRLSFKRSGELNGQPRVTFSRLEGDRQASEDYVRSVLEAFERCLPLPFTPGLGAAVAGRPFTFRFIDDRPT